MQFSYGNTSDKNDIVDAVWIGVTTYSTSSSLCLPFFLLITDVTTVISRAYYDSTDTTRGSYNYSYQYSANWRHEYTFGVSSGSYLFMELLKLA